MSETAWAYLAVSADVQAESLPDQRAWADETAREHGWRIDRYFQAVGSGKHGVRALMQTLLEELENTPKGRRPNRVLMVRVDRTGRGNALDVIAAIAQIRKLGVTIHTRVDGDLRLETAAGSLKTIFDAIQAGLENEARSDRSRSGHRAKRKAGKHAGHAPYGTVLVDGKPHPYEPEASIVREIFERRLQRWGTHRLARYAAEHAPPKRRADGGTRRMKWGENTVGRILRCQTYRGTVVDEELFDAVQSIRHTPIDRTAKYEWPLRGAVHCTCGHLLSTARTGSAKYRIRYYTCRNVAVHKTYPMHRADNIEAQFVALLERMESEPLFPREPAPDVDVMQAQLKALERERESIAARKTRAWEAAEAAGISSEELGVRLAELNANLERTSKAILELGQEITRIRMDDRTRMGAAEAIGELAAGWPTANVEMRREIAKAVARVCGGLWIEPPPPRGAGRSILRFGPM